MQRLQSIMTLKLQYTSHWKWHHDRSYIWLSVNVQL